jgi:hypothetical protein
LGVCSAASWLSLAESRLSIKVFAVLVTVFNVLFANFGETTVNYFDYGLKHQCGDCTVKTTLNAIRFHSLQRYTG